MAGVKEEAIRIIQNLPDDVTMDDVFSELYYRLQVDTGLWQLDEGQSLSQEEVEERLSKWLLI